MKVSKPYIIGIAGGSASGKTSLLNSLLNHFGPSELALVSQDNYYKSKAEQEEDENGVTNFDLPGGIYEAQFYKDMLSLLGGKSIEKTEYNFNNPEAKPKVIAIHPASIIVIEGLFVYHFERIAALMDYKIYVDAPEDMRLNRRIKRDGLERGYTEEDVRYRWANHVKPSYDKFLAPYKPKCDWRIENDASLEPHEQKLVEFIRTKLSENA